jgi:Tol biopolymer transport system component
MPSTLIRKTPQSAALLLLVTACSLAAQGPFTLEQVLSSPFPSELVAAPAGARFAWVMNARGLRNIWVAEPEAGGGYRSRQVTNYTQDDGQEIAELAWTPDGNSIVYARSGNFEQGGAYPNPASDAAGVEQDVWVVALTGASPRRLGEGHAPAVSPHGDEVTYLFKDQIWSVKLAEGAKPEQLIHDKGRCRSLRWSPDGSRLAFVTQRGDHSFVAVYDTASKELHYLDPSVDHDSAPAWSPDSRSVVFLRVALEHEDLIFGPKRAGPALVDSSGRRLHGRGLRGMARRTRTRQRLSRHGCR